MGLILSKQIESRLATLALLETMVMSSTIDVNALLDHVSYFKIERDVARYIKNIVKSNAGAVVTLQEDWKAMARTQVAAFTADTSIDLMKDTFVQHFQAQIQASINVSPDINTAAIADRAKTFTETFISTLVDDVLKKSISGPFYSILYPATKGDAPKASAPHRDDEKDRNVTVKGSEDAVERMMKCLQHSSQ